MKEAGQQLASRQVAGGADQYHHLWKARADARWDLRHAVTSYCCSPEEQANSVPTALWSVCVDGFVACATGAAPTRD